MNVLLANIFGYSFTAAVVLMVRNFITSYCNGYDFKCVYCEKLIF